ncbi:DUF2336 domain-containing protein [Terasakiella sp. SH-1]|uniref:DUF2336 domain-containing protein n=1 Tax=Terasakiella sp. SH-1 TaxID=2560057 RepID=UPI0010730964|nr:DUF2336 domain-containing protein [Terasakiella sp. SH-1]
MIDRKLVHKENLSYEEMQQLAAHPDVRVRCQLAERRDLRPEILYFLAEDKEIEVRRCIAVNPTTPRQADLLLARDCEEKVRVGLTEKIAKLAPDISDAERDKIKSLTYDALMVLSRDQATLVRQILSETLKDVADAPKGLIKQLAKDIELVVAGPVLQFSPVLSDEDLLEIISSSYADGALSAISKRNFVSEAISDAVIATNEVTAIGDLLGNDSAQIREDALDLLADRAKDVAAWHAPLVHRPQLSANAAKRMAYYLADNLLAVLEKRKDLPEDVIDMIKGEVKKRIDDEEQLGLEAEEQKVDPFDEVMKLHVSGQLNEDKVMDWMDEGQWDYVSSALAVMAEVSRHSVKKIVTAQSAKGIMSLVWKAGLEATLAESLQFKLAKIPIKNIRKATPDGEFSLTEDEMNWHLELFSDGY